MNIAEEAAKILHGLPFPLHHQHHESNEQTIRELQEILASLAHLTGTLMNTSLARLQEAANAQVDLITAAQTRVNTLEASNAAGGVDLTQFTANADLDDVSTVLEQNNTALAAVSNVPAATPPAPTPPVAGPTDGTTGTTS